jgi:hypothetical protein
MLDRIILIVVRSLAFVFVLLAGTIPGQCANLELLLPASSGTPQPAAPAESVKPGWDMRVRMHVNTNPDDWQARFTPTSLPLSFRAHPPTGDGWIYYQMLGRVSVDTSGVYQYGVTFRPEEAGLSCITRVNVGGVTSVRAAALVPFSAENSETSFAGPVDLRSGTYDIEVIVGCIPRQSGPAMSNGWKDTRFVIVTRAPTETQLRMLRLSEVSHLDKP